MAALAKDRNTVYKEGAELAYKVAASTKIYAGSLVCLDASGYAVPGADTAGIVFVGVAQEYISNSSGADGDKVVRVRRKGAFELTGASLAITDIGTAVFVSDDQTVAKSTTNSVACGKIADFISATSVYVDIDRF